MNEMKLSEFAMMMGIYVLVLVMWFETEYSLFWLLLPISAWMIIEIRDLIKKRKENLNDK